MINVCLQRFGDMVVFPVKTFTLTQGHVGDLPRLPQIWTSIKLVEKSVLDLIGRTWVTISDYLNNEICLHQNRMKVVSFSVFSPCKLVCGQMLNFWIESNLNPCR